MIACFALTQSCTDKAADAIHEATKFDVADPELGLTRDDYNKNMYKDKDEPVEAKVVGAGEPPIPDLAEILVAPKPPKIGEAKLVSIAVTDDVPLKDVLIELARLADVDIEVDSSIAGGIVFRAKDRPFNEVIERIANMAALRYTMKNNVLRVERDTPYIQEYPINFLNIDRVSNGSISVTGGSTTSGGGGGTSSGGSASNGGSTPTSSGGGSTQSGSTSSVNSKSDSDFWQKFDDGIKQILSYSESKRISSAEAAPQPVPVAAPVAAPANASTPAIAGAAPVAAPAPVVAAAPVIPAASTTLPGKGVEGTFYIINKQASALTVSATERQHEMIKRFLATIEANTSSQVLIEAKVLEVTLSENYQTGINWSNFGNTHLNFNGNLSNVVSTVTAVGAPSITFVDKDLLGSGITLSTAVKLLSEFGSTRALSSPRLHAMNNQQAVLSFAEGIVYFNVHIDQTDAVLGTTGQVVTPSKLTINSTENTANIGITLTLQPSIDAANDEVTLSVRPTLTRLTKFVSDPGFEVQKASILAQLGASSSIAAQLSAVSSTVPQIETRELDSVVKIKSGQTLVIGGLLEDSTNNTEAGVPGASEIPFFGNLFKSVNKTTSKKELVIFIRATIVGSNGILDKADKTLYKKFGNDPRPINN